MKLSQNTKDWLAVVAGVLLILLIIGGVAFGIWARFAAPCHDIGWLPIKDQPTRCLTFGRR